MDRKIYRLIKAYDTIVIARHKAPDLDAYGAQFGLYYALKQKFPAKRIYAVGDTNSMNLFQELDKVTDDQIRGSLYLIVDTAVRQMLGDDRHTLAAKVVVIDHHQNDSDISPHIHYKDTEMSSASEMIVRFLNRNKIPIGKTAAKPLYMGIVGDTGRFLYASVKPDTFRIAAQLLATGLDLAQIYNSLYTESLALKQMKAEYLASFQLTPNNVGYRKNDSEFQIRHNIASSAASRMLANQLSGIKEIPIWANFTEDQETGRILCELRSREIPIVEIAKKHGGGGHLLACGATVDTWAQADQILTELDHLLEAQNG